MSLDEKLRAELLTVWLAALEATRGGLIEVGAYKRYKSKKVNKAIAQIKQAFADEIRGMANDPGLIKALQHDGYMTGQDYYDRFAKELPKGQMVNHAVILEAARKASGLQDKP